MDAPQGSGADHQPPDGVVPAAARTDSDEKPDPAYAKCCAAKHDDPDFENKTWGEKWRLFPPDRQVELIFAGAIVVFSICQILVAGWTSYTSGIQMDHMLVAAGDLDDASGRFSRSSAHINNGIGDAVKKLDAQAKATQRSAEAAKSAAGTAISGLRPWIKVTDVQTRGEGPEIPALSFQSSPNWPTGLSQATFQLQISVKNIGQSPARFVVRFELFLPIWKNGYPDHSAGSAGL
jgi:hypothetical protein